MEFADNADLSEYIQPTKNESTNKQYHGKEETNLSADSFNNFIQSIERLLSKTTDHSEPAQMPANNILSGEVITNSNTAHFRENSFGVNQEEKDQIKAMNPTGDDQKVPYLPRIR